MHAKAFIDFKAHPSAIPFYSIFQEEPIPPESSSESLTITSVVAIKERTMENFLKEILNKATKGDNILIVAHGNELGLYLTFGNPKLNVLLQRDAIVPIRRNLAGTDSDSETAKVLMTTERHWQTLKNQIQRVQDLNLNRVDIRACNTGKNKDTLFDLLAFFGCNTLTAPTEYDSYGPIKLGNFTKDPQYWKNWMKSHPKAVTEGDPPNRFALQTKIGPTEVQLDALADTADAAKAWTKRHLSASGDTKLPTVYHGFTNLQTLMFAGDPGFRGKITQVNKGDEPQQKPVDPSKSPLP